mgnify:CR=1 FL=1
MKAREISTKTRTTSSSTTEASVLSIPNEILEATTGLINSYRKILLSLRNQDNALTIANYVLSMKNEINLSDNYRMSLIKILGKLSNFNDENGSRPKSSFSDYTREDLILFLNSCRKTEPADPLHKWIGTYIQPLYCHYHKILQVVILSQFST